MKYVRLYADSNGESHFEDVTVDLTLGDYSPPTPPISISPFVAATQVGFLSAPPGWIGEWHPVPRRHMFFYLIGEMEVEVSDGEVRRFRAGSVVLCEDTGGRGHTTRIVGSEDVITAAVHVPD
jgi:hypothetical protein